MAESAKRLFRPEPIRLNNPLLSDFEGWEGCSQSIAEYLISSTENNKELSQLKSFYHQFTNAPKHKIKNLLNSCSKVRLRLRELVMAAQELQRRGNLKKIFQQSMNIPERPINPMIKDSSFVRMYNDLEFVHT